MKSGQAFMLKVLFVIFLTLLILSLNWKKNSQQTLMAKINLTPTSQIVFIKNQGQVILVNGGKGKEILYFLGTKLPFWQKRIPALVATDAKATNIAGLIEVLRNYDIESVYFDEDKEVNTKTYLTFLKLAEKVRQKGSLDELRQRFKEINWEGILN